MADSLGPTAGEEEPSGWQDVNTPDYLKEVTDGQFVNISIRGYEKNSSSGSPREEYYAFHVVSMYGMFSMWKYLSVVCCNETIFKSR